MNHRCTLKGLRLQGLEGSLGFLPGLGFRL